MFGFFTKFKLSRVIGKMLGSHLNKQAKKLLSYLTDIQSTTLNDACDVIADSSVFARAEIKRRFTTDKIERRDDAKESIKLYSVPLDVLSTSSAFAVSLATKLKTSVTLRTAATELGVSIDEVVNMYTPAFIELAMPQIIRRLIEDRKSLYAGYVVLALAEGEAYELAGDARRRDMVKFFSPSLGLDRDASIRRATKFWNKRNSSGYEYKRNIFGK
jgi:hypothetical protein